MTTIFLDFIDVDNPSGFTRIIISHESIHAMRMVTLSAGEEYLGYNVWGGYFRCSVL